MEAPPMKPIMSLPTEKRNFVVSYSPKAWLGEPPSLFIAEPYVHYLLERHNLLDRFKDIRVASFLRGVPQDMRDDRDFVLTKYDQYLEILFTRLNQIHQTNFSKEFWKRALAVGLTRHITLLYEFFKVCEYWFDTARHTCKVLSPGCHYIPLDYDDNRWFLQHGNFSREQLLSEYVNLFYPSLFPSYQDKYTSPYRVPQGNDFTPHQPTVGVMRALFSKNHLDDLITRSGGAINSIGFDRCFDLYDGQVMHDARCLLSRLEPSFDRFDRFFFSSLRTLMPKVFVEYFKQVHAKILSQLGQYKNLRYAVSEVWLGETYEAIGLAILHSLGVKIVYHEHNYNEHPGLSNFHQHFSTFVDIFAAHGAYPTEKPTPNMVPAGSLFEFTVDVAATKKHRILHVGIKPGASFAYHTHASEEKENALRHFDFVRAYFNQLKSNTIKQIHYRSYPIDDWSRCCTLFYDDFYFIGDIIKGASIDDFKRSGKQAMAESELVVVEYVSTSHLESLSMNIPTIFFLRPDSWALNDASSQMYTELLEVGIAQDHPLKAAEFVEQIKDNPQAWWSRADVQSAKDRFLARNLGKPELMKEYMLQLAQPH